MSTEKAMTAYLDCFSGISGDMFVGALLDAGLPFEDLKAALQSLPFEGYELQVRREERHGIFGTRFEVRVDEVHSHHRTFRDIRHILRQGRLSDTVVEQSIRVFEAIAKAEARIHGVSSEEVHFHEVGAQDSIIDIVGAVYGLEQMGIQCLYASSLPLGSGFVVAAHGRIPVPAPATVELLKGIPVQDSGIQKEMVTPTGAALARVLVQGFGALPSMRIEHTGYGVGSRLLDERPNLLRLLIGKERGGADTDTLVVLETNLDDVNPEWLGHLMEQLFEAGALDVVFCPVHMKKNRPGTQVQVLAPPPLRDALMDILFQETGTLGIRYQYALRTVLDRSVMEVESPWGPLQIKKVVQKGRKPVYLPEYEACKVVALRNRRPLREIFCWVMSLNASK